MEQHRESKKLYLPAKLCYKDILSDLVFISLEELWQCGTMKGHGSLNECSHIHFYRDHQTLEDEQCRKH